VGEWVNEGMEEWRKKGGGWIREKGGRDESEN